MNRFISQTFSFWEWCHSQLPRVLANTIYNLRSSRQESKAQYDARRNELNEIGIDSVKVVSMKDGGNAFD